MEGLQRRTMPVTGIVQAIHLGWSTISLCFRPAVVSIRLGSQRDLKLNQNNNPVKSHQQRLITRIFGREATQLVNQYGNEGDNSQSIMSNKANLSRPPLNRKPSNDVSSTNVDSGRENKSENIKPKDFDIKLERALLDLSEHKNNFYKEKSDFDKQIEQTRKDKDVRMRQTLYGSSPYPGAPSINSNGAAQNPASVGYNSYYGSMGFPANQRFRPSTQENGHSKRISIQNDGLSDGELLSKIDSISPEELKERLYVAEMIMKKLYARNKDLETAFGKAQTKIKEVKRHTTQNFFRNTMNAFEKENGQNQENDDNEDNKDKTIEQIDETQNSNEDSEIEIG